MKTPSQVVVRPRTHILSHKMFYLGRSIVYLLRYKPAHLTILRVFYQALGSS